MIPYVWEDVSNSRYTAEETTVGDLYVTVCLDDEGPLRPAFYWDIYCRAQKVTSGWASTVDQARIDAVTTAERLLEEASA